MMAVFLRKYGELATVHAPLIARNTTDLLLTMTTWPQADLKIQTDDGLWDVGDVAWTADDHGQAKISLSPLEMTGKRIKAVLISRATTKVYEDQTIYIETYGHPDAMHPFDLGSVVPDVNVLTIEGADATDQIRDAVISDGDGTLLTAAALNGLAANDPGSVLASKADITALNNITAEDVAAAVWSEDVSGYTTTNQAGDHLNDIKAVTDQFITNQPEPTGVPSANIPPLDKLARLFAALQGEVQVSSNAMTFFSAGGLGQWKKALDRGDTVYTEFQASAP